MTLLLFAGCATDTGLVALSPEDLVVEPAELALVRPDDGACREHELTIVGSGVVQGLTWLAERGDPGDLELPDLAWLEVEGETALAFRFCPWGDEPVAGQVLLTVQPGALLSVRAEEE